MISDEGFADEYLRGNALIRSAFFLEPEKLSLTDWSKLYNEALWLERFRLKNQADLLARLFGGK